MRINVHEIRVYTYIESAYVVFVLRICGETQTAYYLFVNPSDTRNEEVSIDIVAPGTARPVKLSDAQGEV